MDLFAFLVVIGALIFVHSKLSARLEECERMLNSLKKTQQQTDNSTQFSPIQTEVIKESFIEKLTVVEVPPASHLNPQIEQVTQNSIPTKSFEIPNIIKENWMGVFGSIALVIGAVFFGLTADIMQYPEFRVGIMLAVSFVFLGFSQKLKYLPDWTLLTGWLKSIAGAVILFATLGAGGIQGLQFIDSPVYALLFLSFGISVNILLAITSPSQAVASLHVILSILAFCIIPQAFILLPIGALISCIGMISAYRSKWDLHLLLIVIAFAIQNTFWTLFLENQLLPWTQYIAIACSLLVGLIAACIHYSKKYESTKLEALPLIAHISNWGILSWNIWLHAQYFRWTPLVLGALAMTGFILARVAKKKKIIWLHYTDTLISQLVAMFAIASMSTFSANYVDLSLMIVVETLIFNFICRLQNEYFILRVGYSLQYISYLVALFFTTDAFLKDPLDHPYRIYLRMAIVAGVSWAYHIYGSMKGWFVDDFRFILTGKRDIKDTVSITTLLGTVFFIGIYFFGFGYITIQSIVLMVSALMGIYRSFKEDQSWNIAFIASLILVHTIMWGNLANMLESTFIPSIFSRADFLGLVLLDAILIFGNFLQFKLWQPNIHKFVMYAFGAHVGLLIFVVSQKANPFIPDLLFLGFSILSLEVGRRIPQLFRYKDDVKQNIREGMIHIGFAYLILFLMRFVALHLILEPMRDDIYMRLLTEALGLLAIAYWISFLSKKEALSEFEQLCYDALIEVCIGFITICAIAELSGVWLIFFCASMAIGLVMGSLINNCPNRLCVYSWIFMFVSIVYNVFIPRDSTSSILLHNIPAFIVVTMQLFYALIVHRKRIEILKRGDSSSNGIRRLIPVLFRQPNLTILLPIFVGIAVLFAFDFSDAILTLVWVGLGCIYLVVGLFVKSKRTIQIAMGALVLCCLRLMIFDMLQSDVATRALVFLGVGGLMLGVSILYKKFKHRIDFVETSAFYTGVY